MSFSSRITYVESRAALAAAWRSGRIDAGGLRLARQSLESLTEELEVIEVAEELTRRAGDLAEERGLRGYDALHLATALTAGQATTMVTWDLELASASVASGLAVVGP